MTCIVSCDGYTGIYDGQAHAPAATAYVPDGSAADNAFGNGSPAAKTGDSTAPFAAGAAIAAAAALAVLLVSRKLRRNGTR